MGSTTSKVGKPISQEIDHAPSQMWKKLLGKPTLRKVLIKEMTQVMKTESRKGITIAA